MTVKSPKPIVLVAVDGDVDPGTEYPVTPNEPVPIGRSAKGITLLDRMVSIQHAVIHFDLARGYVIQDLGSATGTWVDEECIKGESRPIGVGTVLRFGDTVFEVARPARIMPWMQVVLVAAAVMLMVAGLWSLSDIIFDSEEGGMDVSIQVMDRTFDVLLIDHEYLRSQGISVRHLDLIREPQDYDDNGIEEIWLKVRPTGEELLITFPLGARSTKDWIVLGKFPGNCVVVGDDSEGSGFFRRLECEGTVWDYFEADPERGLEAGYQLQYQDGVVVYYRPRRFGEPDARPKEGRKEEGPLAGLGRILGFDNDIRVARLSVKSWPDLSRFLVGRGITEPVHYFLCESAFEGLPAQAVLGNGNVARFSQGCHGEITLNGEVRGEPVAVAVSPTGHIGLINDVLTYYAGDPDGLFLPPDREKVRSVLTARPGFMQGGSRLVANPFGDTTTEYEVRPDRPLAPGPRYLENLGLKNPSAPPAVTTTIVKENDLTYIDMPNCGRLRVWSGSFQNRGVQAMVSGTFSRVSDDGCTEREIRLFAMNYPVTGGASQDAMVGNYRVRALVESEAAGQGVEVLRYRIAYRCEDCPPPGPAAH